MVGRYGRCAITARGIVPGRRSEGTTGNGDFATTAEKGFERRFYRRSERPARLPVDGAPVLAEIEGVPGFDFATGKGQEPVRRVEPGRVRGCGIVRKRSARDDHLAPFHDCRAVSVPAQHQTIRDDRVFLHAHESPVVSVGIRHRDLPGGTIQHAVRQDQLGRSAVAGMPALDEPRIRGVLRVDVAEVVEPCIGALRAHAAHVVRTPARELEERVPDVHSFRFCRMRDLVREGVAAEPDVAVAAEVNPRLVLAHVFRAVLREKISRECDAALQVGAIRHDGQRAVRVDDTPRPDVLGALGPRIAGHQVLVVGVCDALRDHERPRTRTRDRVPEAHRAANETNLVLWSSVELQTGVLEHQVTSGDVDVAGIVRLEIVQEQLRRRAGEREAVHVEPSVGIAAHAPACRTAHRRIGRHLEVGEHVVVSAAGGVAEHGAGAARRARAAHDEFRPGFVHRLRIFGRAAGGGEVERGARRHRHDRRRAVVVDGGRAEDAGVDRDRAGKRVRDGDAVVEVRLAVAFLHDGRKDRQRP